MEKMIYTTFEIMIYTILTKIKIVFENWIKTTCYYLKTNYNYLVLKSRLTHKLV